MSDTILEVEKEHFSESIGNDNGARWSDVIYKGLSIRKNFMKYQTYETVFHIPY